MFSEEDLSKILQYLGYPKQTGLVASTSDGTRMNSPSLDYLYTSLLRLSPEGETRAREDMCKIHQVDVQLASLITKATLESTGDLKFNMRAGRTILLAERRRLVNQLADDLGAPPNPFAHGGGPRVSNT